MRTNVGSLVRAVVVGVVSDSSCAANPAMVGSEGLIVNFFGTGGVSINVSIGDSAFGWAADHIEPGVSLIHPDDVKSRALNHYACIGNKAVIVKAALNDVQKIVGNEGLVTGKHGGAERVLVWFDKQTMAAMTPDDVIRIETHGFNLKLLDFPQVYLRNMSPQLLERLPLKEVGGTISAGVTKILPGCLMGSGLGTGNTFRGDVDIQTTDSSQVQAYALDQLCLGDVVAITDYDTTFGASQRKGSVTIGLVVHGTSQLSGHGPGMISLITTRDGNLIQLHEQKVNLADLYKTRDR
jgi:hypothetical protein